MDRNELAAPRCGIKTRRRGLPSPRKVEFSLLQQPSSPSSRCSSRRSLADLHFASSMAERDWASLERGVLLDIFNRLPTDVDAIRFRGVCPNWRVAAGGAGALGPRPWFILNPADADSGHGDAFVRPEDRRGHATRVRSVRADSAAAVTGVWPPTPTAYVRGTSRGWLAVEEGERLLLRDPISRAEIPLPAFDAAGYQMFDVFLSDDPLAAPGSWSAFAFFRWDDVVDTHNPGDVLAFCRPGDAEWARVDPVDGGGQGHGHQTQRYRGLEFFGGRPYVLLAEPSGKLAVCDVEALRLVVSSVWIYTPPPAHLGWQECLVECGGDLLVVQVARQNDHRSPWYCPGCCLYSNYFFKDKIWYYARVFKIVFDKDDSGMPVASELLRGIGDYAVFVAPRGHAFALPAASDFPAVRKGCVYFFAVSGYRRNVQGMVVIDLQPAARTRRDKIVRKLPLDGNWHILSWFCPRRQVLDTTPPPRRRRCSVHGLRNALPFLN